MSTLRERFETKYIKIPDGCWIWTGARFRSGGYGAIRDGATTLRAHCVSYGFHKGKIPAGMVVMHSCDNPPCVNPDHLSVGTLADNNSDCIRKGRGNRARGERAPTARLTPSQVREIQGLALSGLSTKSIADRFGVGKSSVNSILTGRNWRHVTGGATAVPARGPRTLCPSGHPRDGTTTARKSHRVTRYCKTCSRARAAAYKIKMRSAGNVIPPDNLPGSAKGVRDEIAAIMGVTDGPEDGRVTWRVEQRKGAFGVEVEIRTTEGGQQP